MGSSSQTIINTHCILYCNNCFLKAQYINIMMASSMMMMITTRFPLLLPYGFMCLKAHLGLYILFRYLLPGSTTTTTRVVPPWTQSPSLTAHRMVAFCAMIHWTYLGFRHIGSFDYSTSQSTATLFIPAGFDLAQCVMGALVCWDIPSSVVGGSGPTDLMMHLHHGGMLLVVSCVLWGKVGTHVAPIFLGVIELSSIPLQLVDLFHPTKSPHWHQYINHNNDNNNNNNDTTLSTSSSSSSAAASATSATRFFPKVCSTVNDISRMLFALLFLVIRGLYFPYIVVTIAIPDFYLYAVDDGSSSSSRVSATILLIMSILFSLLQLYWATLVVGQIRKATNTNTKKSGSRSGSGKEQDTKLE